MSTEAATFPPLLPEPNAVTQFFWDAVAAHRLEILRCNACGWYVHWPRESCPSCLSTDLSPQQMSGRATLDTFTNVFQPYHPFFFDKVPYALAVVELTEQTALKMVTNIVGVPYEQLRIGMALQVVFREVAPGLTLPLFQPAAGSVGS